MLIDIDEEVICGMTFYTPKASLKDILDIYGKNVPPSKEPIKEKKMSKKEKLVSAFDTLVYSWGSDTPNEATWAANEMMEAITGKDNVYVLLDKESEAFDALSETEQELMYENFISQLDSL